MKFPSQMEARVISLENSIRGGQLRWQSFGSDKNARLRKQGVGTAVRSVNVDGGGFHRNRCVPRSILTEDIDTIDSSFLPISLSFLDSPSSRHGFNE